MTGELKVLGAAEHNLRDVDVTFGPGLTAVVGVSGSGKSSLAFDVIYSEAHRRFVESLALGPPGDRARAARVPHIEGLGPAVAVAQNLLNRNPLSTVATSVGLHPFFRILYARFAEVTCPRCAVAVRSVSHEERLAIALEMLTTVDTLDVEVTVERHLPGSHARLLTGLRGRFDAVTIDGRAWATKTSSRIPRLDADKPHDVVVRVATLRTGMPAADIRATLERADALGTQEVRLGGTPMLRAPICPSCGRWVRPLGPSAFRLEGFDTSSHRVAGVSLPDLIARSVSEVLTFVEHLPSGLRAKRIQDELLRRLRPLETLGLGHLALDRSMPMLSRGEAQRTRLAVVLSGRLEDLLHVLDEPTIGLHHADLKRLLEAVASLPGPVKDLRYDCDACHGRGNWLEGMWFLPSVTQTYDACAGRGYRHEITELVERGRSLADIEGLTIAEVVDEWRNLDAVRRVGDAAIALGLGYLIVRLPGWSLSGGEAQRVKLAKERARRAKGGALYVLDEPTVGLQATDVAVLAGAIVEAGNTVLDVGHDPALLATCDWLIEMGPGAGPEGGQIIFEGTPEELANTSTPTAPYLVEALT